MVMNPLNTATIVLSLFCFTLSEGKSSISCKNEDNNNVDWYINYKLPKLEDFSRDTCLGQGTAYAYLSSDGDSGQWTLSSIPISSEDSMVGNTLANFYDKQQRKELTYLLYNDETPGNSTRSSPGHTKGIVLFDDTSGVWIIHSVPKFPSVRSYRYPKNGYENGQSVLCITFDVHELNEIGKQLLYNGPRIYADNLHESVESLLDDDVKSLFSDKPAFIRKAPFSRITTIRSLGKVKFTVFAKDNQLRKDLYSSLIAPELEAPLLVESWRRGGGGLLPAFCKRPYNVLDVESIVMSVINDKKKVKLVFPSTEDHSKWAISRNGTSKWICIGDINRMVSQRKRGGGSACFEAPKVWSAFSNIVERTDTC